MEIMAEFIRSELYYLADIMEQLENINELSELEQLLGVLDKIAEIEACIFTGIEYENGEIKTNCVVNRFPEEWVKHYLKSNYDEVDTVTLASLNDPGIPRQWKEIYKRNPPPQKFLHESTDFNLNDGFALGWKHQIF